jgi:hypothetical protein
MQGAMKHVEKRNKHTKKICAPSWLYLQDYTRMQVQQNLKNLLLYIMALFTRSKDFFFFFLLKARWLTLCSPVVPPV